MYHNHSPRLEKHPVCHADRVGPCLKVKSARKKINAVPAVRARGIDPTTKSHQESATFPLLYAPSQKSRMNRLKATVKFCQRKSQWKPWSSTWYEMSTELIFDSPWRNPRTTARALVSPAVSFVPPNLFESSALPGKLNSVGCKSTQRGCAGCGIGSTCGTRHA